MKSSDISVNTQPCAAKNVYFKLINCKSFVSKESTDRKMGCACVKAAGEDAQEEGE